MTTYAAGDLGHVDVHNRLADVIVDVREWSIIDDGETDNTAAINTAIDELGASGGGRLYFPFGSTGRYGIGSTINLDQHMVKLVGPGRPRSWVSGMTSGVYLVALSAFSAGTAAIKIQSTISGSRLHGVGVEGIGISGDPRLLNAAATDAKNLPIGIQVDLSHLAVISNVLVDHTSSAGIKSAANGGGVITGPDQLFLRDVVVSVCAGNGIDIRHGHSFHHLGGLVEYCDVGYYLGNRNSFFVSNVDVETNYAEGVLIPNARNVVFRDCTFENNGRTEADDSVSNTHIRVGSFSRSDLLTMGCFFHADSMRHLVYVDEASYIDIGSYCYDADAVGAWVGSSTVAVPQTVDTVSVTITGDFGQSWPVGSVALTA